MACAFFMGQLNMTTSIDLDLNEPIENTHSTEWSTQHARELYNIEQWSEGYFDINEHGHVTARPRGWRNSEQAIDLVQLTEAIQAEGLTLPVLVRFTDILQERSAHLQRAFAQAMHEYNYHGKFTAVYPIKVNQQRWVVEEILSQDKVGLEAGSKPELMAVIALLANRNNVVICNGYKDREYIRLALIGQRLGHRVYLILEKFSELPIILEEAQKMGIKPRLGIRVRLAAMGTGRWQHTSGEKSKFGFSAAQVLHVVEYLRQAGQLDLLQLLHFNLGSQIANIGDIQRGMRECARYYAELHALGVNIRVVDVGGGLGVDYEGTRSRGYFSMNYSIQEYANNIVYSLVEICNRNLLPCPEIITESGRAMTAHHAMLIVNVIDVEKAQFEQDLKPVQPKDSQVLQELWHGLMNISERSALEAYHDACHWMGEVHSMYNHGIISLKERAHAEQIYIATCHKARDLLKPSVRAHREVIDELNEKLAHKFFCNFSLFQSLPDAWAIDQVFPIMPLAGLKNKPTCRGILQDITCDSDGKIEFYVDGQGVDSTLPLLPYENGKPYWLGIFLVGAYQEILGDLHNLFGDTYSVHVALDEKAEHGYQLRHPLQGDRVANVLQYVHFNSDDLLASYQKQFEHAELTPEEASRFLQILKEGLQGYTYLEDE